MLRALPWPAVVLTSALLAADVVGQSPADRLALSAFRDSLTAAKDSSALKEIEGRLMTAARRDRSKALLHMQLGMVAERLGVFSDAAAEFKWATQLEPRWPIAWFDWGMAELRLGDEIKNAQSTRQLILTRDAWSRAELAFARAVQLDSAMAGQSLEGARAAVEIGRADWARVIRDGLRRVAANPREDAAPTTLLALGRVELALGDTAAAVAAFDRAAVSAPWVRGEALFERARAQLSRRDQRGMQAYFDGASADDSAAVRVYRTDLALIASDRELTAFDERAGEARSRFLWDFWIGRDRVELRPNGERLMEHVRRISAARSAYQSAGDARARVLIRQGEPAARASLRHASIPANESWWYPRVDGDFVVHFVATKDSSDYKMVDSIFEIAGLDLEARGPASDEAGTPAVGADQLLRSRAQLSPFYQGVAVGSRRQLADFATRDRELAARGHRVALTTDRFPIRFNRELAARIQVASLGGSPAGGELNVLFSIPRVIAAGSGGSAWSGDSALPTQARVRLVVRDSVGAVARAVDTVVPIQATSIAGAGDVGGRLTLPVAAGRYSAKIAIDLGEAGAIVVRDSIDVAGAATELALSDIVLGGPTAPTRWISEVDSAEVVADPAPVVARRDALALFAEVSGLGGTRARVRVRVRRAAGAGGKVEGWRSFPGSSESVIEGRAGAGSATALRLSLPMRKLDRGAFELEVLISDDAGRTAVGRGRFEVRDRLE